jgi:hypothetical protein
MAKQPVFFDTKSKWTILSVKPDAHLSEAVVIDKRNLKRHEVYIEHIKEGQKLLYGRTATKTEDRFLDDRIPKYIQEKILTYIKERV